MADVLDLDQFVPAKKLARFTDRAGKIREFDISFVSFKTGIIAMSKSSQFKEMSENPHSVTREEFRSVLEIISSMAQASDPELTVDFLEANLSVLQGIIIETEAMKPIQEFMASNMVGVGKVGKDEESE